MELGSYYKVYHGDLNSGNIMICKNIASYPIELKMKFMN